MSVIKIESKKNVLKYCLSGVLVMSLLFFSCEKGFDQIVIGEDVLSPGEVTNIKAIESDGSVMLTWSAPIDFDLAGYVISYTPNGVGDINLEKVNQLLVESLENDVEYTFTISSKDLLGNISLGATITATPKIETGPPVVSFTEDFNSSCPAGLPSGWLSFSASTNTEWECVDPNGDGNYAVQGNNFGADIAADDWLITPGIDLPAGNKVILNFKYSAEFSDAAGFGLNVVISTNYSGSGDPASATWTTLNTGINNSLSSSTFANSNSVSLSNYMGIIYVAFRYTSSGTGGGTTLRGRLDDISIAEPVFENFPFTEDFNLSCPSGLPENWLSFSASSNTEWECVDPQSDGNYALQGNNFGADVAANDWLITPGIELPDSNIAQLNFTYSAEFSDAAGFGLDAMISSDYSGTGDPSTATWISLNAGINNALGSNVPVSASPVSLSGYSGVVYIAFKYTSSGTGGGTTLRARLFDMSITEPVLQNFPFSENFNLSCPTGLPNDWLSFSASNNTEWECVDPQSDGNYAVQGNNWGADVAANDWLITPGIELATSNTAQLNFKYSAEFSDAAGFGLDVMISTDYSGSGDPTSATWTALGAGINNALGSNVPVSASPVSLSAYSGIVYVAFKYTSSGTGNGTTLRARLFEVAVQ